MRILMVSKYKEFLGGVESHLRLLEEGLSRRGHEVFVASSEDLAASDRAFDSVATDGSRKLSRTARAASQMLWNVNARESVSNQVGSFRPDVIHYHSIYHQLSPSVVSAKFSRPSVMTLHDYKVSAPCYTLYRDGEVCTRCVGRRFASDAVRFRCVRDSYVASALCSVEGLFSRLYYKDRISRFVVPSQYARQVLVASGIAEDRIVTIRWGVRHGTPEVEPGWAPERRVVFCGRLHETKGIRQLIRAWSETLSGSPGWKLQIVGGGECADDAIVAAARFDNVDYLGTLGSAEVAEVMAKASLVVTPSLFPETFGLSAAEALASGIPVAISGRGALPELGTTGVFVVSEPIGEGLRLLLSEFAERPDKVDKAAAALRGISEVLNVDDMVRAHENLYQDLLRRN